MGYSLGDWRCEPAAYLRLLNISTTVSDQRFVRAFLASPSGRRPLYVADRKDKIWTERDIAAFLAVTSSEIQLALILALWSGQRQGDLLRLPWSAYETPYIRLRQSKGGRRVAMPAGAPLRALLDATTRRGPVILWTCWAAPGRPMAFVRRGRRLASAPVSTA